MNILNQNKDLFWQTIAKYNRFLLCLHVSADADSLCSNTAMKELLVKMGKNVTIITGNNKTFSKDLQNLPWLDLVTVSTVEELNLADYDCFIMIDAAVEDRLHALGNQMSLPKIVIDHHISNNIVDAELGIVDGQYSSAAQMVYELGIGYEPHTTDFLQAVYIGMYADTGGFKFNVSPRLFEVASSICEQTDVTKIVSHYSQSIGRDDMAMLGIAANNNEMFDVGGLNFCLVTISNENMNKYPEIVDETNTNTVVKLFSDMKGIDVLVIASQRDEDDWRVRVRSFIDGEHAKQIAEYFGGGGHPHAASGKFPKALPQTVTEAIKNATIELYNK